MHNTTPANANAIIPKPASLTVAEGEFILTKECVVVVDEATRLTSAALTDALRPALGWQLAVVTTPPADARTITLMLDPTLTGLGSEGYQLQVTCDAVTLTAPTQAGLFYAVQTLRQLLPPESYSRTVVTRQSWPIPCVTISDQPRFAWRGLMLDTGHDFQPLSYIFRFIDLMALHKFNVFHWHIGDLGIFPLEIEGYPKLQDPQYFGDRERGTPPRRVRNGRYTQDEARAVVAYAAARHITVLPEIDMPGHSTPILNAYPELDCPVPLKEPGEGVGWTEVVRWEYCLGNEAATDFLKEVLSQVMAIFPSTYIHIGGDECPSQHWERCPVCRQRCQSEGLADSEALRLWFLQRIERFLRDHGRRMIGWDELYQNGIGTTTAIMAWRTPDKLRGPAARDGHEVVVAEYGHLYFDFSEEATPLSKTYAYEPMPAGLDAAASARVLGVQAQLWSDHHPEMAEIDRLLYPRATAVAEIAWSAAGERNWDDFTSRLQPHIERLAHGFGIAIPASAIV